MEVDEKSFKIEGKKAFEYLADYIKLMREGKSTKDSFTIFVYFLGTPLRIIKRKFGIYPKPKLIYNVAIKNKDGEFFCGDSWLMTQGAISNYEPKSREHMVLNKGVFIDVGANIGKYSIMVGRQLKDEAANKDYGIVVAVEASNEIFKILEKNIRLNNLSNVIPINLAVSDKKGVSEFYLASEGLGTASSLIEIKYKSKKIKVKTDTLDNITKRLNIKKVDLIKIDVEGVEPKVLEGALGILKKDKPKIVFEALNKKCFDECEKILRKFNYKIERLGHIDFVAEVKI
jgi:FkbM family methyltransferase